MRTGALVCVISPALHLLDNHSIAFARSLFQSGSVFDDHLPAFISDQSPFLQGAGGNRDAGPARAQHVGKEFLSEQEFGFVDTVLSHQQPSGQSPIDFMKAIAGGDLNRLKCQFLRITLQILFQHGAGRKRGFQIYRGYLEPAGSNLNHSPCGAGKKSDDQRETDETFIAGQTHFHAFSSGDDVDDGSHAAVEEVSGGDRPGNLIQNQAGRQFHKLHF